MLREHRTGPAMITGDWMEDADGVGATASSGYRCYPGYVVGGWSGGVFWTCDRATAELVVRDQTEMAADCPGIDMLVWEGDDIVWVQAEGTDGTPDRVVLERAGDQYHMPGWAWVVDHWLDED